jgi:hypothetical protein
MKKVLVPSTKEESVYYSDFTGKCFGIFDPEVVLKLQFNYGSERDGSEITLHLTDCELEPILEIIKNNLTEEAKKSLLNTL